MGDYSNAEWDGSKARFELEELEAAVPRAVLRWARAQARAEKRDLTKSDLKLPYREPDGTINANAIAAALGRLGSADLPDDVKAAARAELERESKRAARALAKREQGGVAQGGKPGEMRVSEITAARVESVDVAAGMIRGAKLLGANSSNKRRYTDPALASAAAAYEGLPVSVDHPPLGQELHGRPFDSRLGFVRGARMVAGDGVYGDVVANPAHPALARLPWFAAHPEARVGFSANHVISGHWEGETFVVESVPSAVGIDLVGDPATVRGVFEQAEDAEEEDVEIKTVEELRKAFPELVKVCEQEAGAKIPVLEAELKTLRDEKAAAAKRARIEALATEQNAARIMTPAFRELLFVMADEGTMRAAIADRLSVAPLVAAPAAESRSKSMADQTGAAGAAPAKLVPPSVTDAETCGAWLRGS